MPEPEQKHALAVPTHPFQGNPVGMTVSPVCTKALTRNRSWEEWRVDAVSLAHATRACTEPEACTPLAADRGQCPPGNYAFV